VRTFPTYTVSITVEAPNGAKTTAKFEDCPREALLQQPSIAPILRLFEDDQPDSVEQEAAVNLWQEPTP
jgi:hypothetical protein